MGIETQPEFISRLGESLKTQEFVKLTLGKYRGTDAALNRIVIRAVQLKSGLKLSFTYCYKTQEIVKNYPIEPGLVIINSLLGSEFMSARLFTPDQDIQVEYNKSKKITINLLKPASTNPYKTAPQGHDRKKTRWIESENNLYLTALGVTNGQGGIVKSMEDKFRQINKFIEIVQSLLESSGLDQKSEFSIVDMGSGKGYLTFALYDFLNTISDKCVSVTGIESRKNLVDFCNQVAASVEFDQLHFDHGTIKDHRIEAADVTIALHACDTATDDAIYQGIQSKSSLIILAPCCHKQIRKEIHPSGSLKDLLKFGILLERQAEIVTDGLRALFLELSGYDAKVFEFISPEHTSKNLMVVGVKHDRTIETTAVLQQIKDLKNLYGIKVHYLESLLFPNVLLSPNLADLI
jgi:hypothetical protein